MEAIKEVGIHDWSKILSKESVQVSGTIILFSKEFPQEIRISANKTSGMTVTCAATCQDKEQAVSLEVAHAVSPEVVVVRVVVIMVVAVVVVSVVELLWTFGINREQKI